MSTPTAPAAPASVPASAPAPAPGATALATAAERLFDVHAHLFRAARPALDGLRLEPPAPAHPSIAVVMEGFPREVWARLPLRDVHEPDPAPAEANHRLGEALDHLARYPERYRFVTRFVRLVVWVRPTTERASQTITSASFPAFPHAVFMSRRALRHIPPRTVVGESVRLLAENLFHEAVHQDLTIRILRGELLVPEFQSATSPRIPIPWRADDTARNRSWEIDRSLHALAVYANVLEYRLDELADAGLELPVRAAYEEASRQARESVTHLMREIVHHRELLTPAGRAWLEGILERGAAAVARIDRHFAAA